MSTVLDNESYFKENNHENDDHHATDRYGVASDGI